MQPLTGGQIDNCIKHGVNFTDQSEIDRWYEQEIQRDKERPTLATLLHDLDAPNIYGDHATDTYQLLMHGLDYRKIVEALAGDLNEARRLLAEVEGPVWTRALFDEIRAFLARVEHVGAATSDRR